MKSLKKILLIVNIALIIGLLLAYQSPTIDPATQSVYPFFGVFYPLFLLGNLFMVLCWMLVDYKYLIFSVLAIIFGWSHLTNFVNVNGPVKGDMDIRVMSYNLSNSYSIRDSDVKIQRKKAKLFGNYLQGLESPDIMFLQECGHYGKSIFSGNFPGYHIADDGDKAAVIYSKYPILRQGSVEFGTKTNSCVYADVKVNKDTIRVYNIHLQSNSISDEADAVLVDQQLDQPETWNSIRHILSKYQAASRIRAIQAKKVKKHASSSPYPVLIVGDFNDPPTSYPYNVLSEGLQDAFHVRGSGIGTTYGGSIPMLRIDYILADPSFTILEYSCRKEKFSDHYPIFAELSL